MNSEKKQKLGEYAATLNDLQGKIASADGIAIEQGKIALELAINAGTILNEAKGLVHYGTWKKWLAENVKGITERTAQNWMKLAKHTDLLVDCKGLNEAYLVLRIKKKPVMDNPERGAGNQSPTPGEPSSNVSANYQDKLNYAKGLIAQRVIGELQNAGVDWNVTTWTIRNDKPASNDATNKLTKTIYKLAHAISIRNHTTLKTEDETEAKIQILLTQILNAIIKASCPQQPETPKAVSPSSVELNTTPAEGVEELAA